MAHAASHSPGLRGVSGRPLLPCRIWPSSAVVVGLVLICYIGGVVVDVVLPVLMQRQATAVLVSLQWRCHRFSSSTLTVVDVPVVRQRQVPTAFRVLLRVWKRSLLCAASRYSHLDPGHCSYVLLVTGWHSAPVFSRQYMVASGRISGIFCVVSAHEQSALGNLDVLSTSLVAGLPRNARHVPVLFLEAFGCISNIFNVLVYSDPVIDSRPALRGVLSLIFQGTV